jgi:hypothetical protein
MNNKYSFTTHWQLEAPIQPVWEAIYDSLEWPNWWKGVKSVEELKKPDNLGLNGSMRYTWKSVLPYSLVFNMRVIEKEAPVHLKGIAYGELEGQGEWHLTENAGITDIIYNWDVITTKKWMNSMAFLLKPLFRLNHNIVMHWGAEGLAKKLNVRLIKG